MRRVIYPAVLTIVLMLAAAARAADPPAMDPAIAPFIDDQTILVIRADVPAVDLKALRAQIDKAINASKIPDDVKAEVAKELPRTQALTQAWMDEFKQAGGKRIYMEFNLADIDMGPAFIVPMGAGADAEAMQNLFATGHARKALDEKVQGKMFAMSHACMLFCPEFMMIDKVKARQAAPRPDLAKAFADAGDAPLCIVFVPSDDARAAIIEMAPALDREMGGGSMSDLLGSLTSSWGLIAMKPEPAIKLVANFKDADGAAKALAGVNLIRDSGKNSFDAAKGRGHMLPGTMLFENIFPLIEPVADGTKVSLTVSGDKFDTFDSSVVGIFFDEMVQSRRMSGKFGLESIGRSIEQFTNQNKGVYPADFAELLTKGNGGGQAYMFINYRTGTREPENWNDMKPEERGKWVNEHADFVYAGAGLKTGADPETVVAYEKPSDDNTDGMNILFADGHVDYLNADDAKKALEKSKALREKP